MTIPLARTAKPGRSLSRLAESAATGVLTVHGEPTGEVHLRDGLVTRAVAYRSVARPGSLLDTADQLFVLCWGRVRETRFVPGPGDQGAAGVPVARLLAEVDRRTAALAAHGQPVDPLADRLRRSPTGSAALVPGAAALGAAMVSTDEERLLARADGTATCVDLAPQLGRSVYGTALDATRMVRGGLLEVVPARAGEVAEVTPLQSLSQRRPGGTGAAPREPAPALWDRDDPEAVERLRSALDSLRAARRFAGTDQP